VLGLAAALAGHERSLATILGGLLCGQFGLHVLFAAVQQPAVTHLKHGTEVAMAPVSPATQAGSGMMLAHLAAAGASAWWLRRGERVAWSLTRQIATLAGRPIRALHALPGEVPIIGPVRIQPRVVRPSRPLCPVLRYVVVLRGPPARPQVFSGALSA
jgi:hypothetical protein